MNNNLFRYQGYIGGVCEGLSIWSGIPSILWRISFVFFIPAAFWIYIILWIFLKNLFENNVVKLLHCN